SPRPLPMPAPPQQDSPYPEPYPVPFEGTFSTLVSAPTLPCWLSFTCGGTIDVCSTASFGSGLRITTVGGVICFIENFGGTPLLACRMSRSPPPPPPPVTFFDEGSGMYAPTSITGP